jgi:two-component system sensor histidine kinase ChiS
MPLILGLLFAQYGINRDALLGEFTALRMQTEDAIRQSLKMIDGAQDALEIALDHVMLHEFDLFVEAYRASGADPAQMDLESIKARLEYDMDLFVIDLDGIVIHSTYPPDLGLDLSVFPHFYPTFLRNASKGEPWADRIVPSVKTGELRKFAYMPTPDGKYVLEFGLSTTDFSFLIRQLDPENLSPRLMEFNPNLRSIRFFDPTLNRLIEKLEEQIDARVARALERAREAPYSYESQSDDGLIVRYIYVDLRDYGSGGDPSRIVELSYDASGVDRRLAEITWMQLGLGALSIAAAIALAGAVASRVTRPIVSLAARISSIDDSSLDARLATEARNEVKDLADGVNALLDRLARSMEERNESASRAERMAIIGTLVASVAHDVNTPLGLCLSTATFLSERVQAVSKELADRTLTESRLVEFSADVREGLGILTGNLERAATLVRSFKRVAADNSGEERYRFPLRELVEDVFRSLRPAIRSKPVELTVSCECDLTLYANPGELSQVLGNLTMNSLVHGFDEGGRAGRIEVRLFASGKSLTIEHSDDGSGIAPEDINRVFDAHFSTKREKGGSGLGLSIVKRIVERSFGGTIRVESGRGLGCRFICSIPLDRIVAGPGDK